MSREFVLTKRQDIATGTTEISLTTTDGAAFRFQAGQHLDLIIPDPLYIDESGNKRSFSIASAPAGAEVSIAYRQSESAFKKSLATMTLGTSLIAEGPFGVFTLPNDIQAPLVFIAGGIGITPFHSILGSLKNVPHRMLHLLYANRDEASAAYLEELRAQARVGAIKLKEHYGPLNATAIQSLAETKSASETIYYIAGPPGFVMTAMSTLEAVGIPRGQVIIEQFLGYE